MWTCFLHWGVHPLALRSWIWEVAFWAVTKCDSHKLRHIRNPCSRLLWFDAFCDHGRGGHESKNTENVFWVLGRVPMFTFDRNLRGWVLTFFRIICHMYCILFTKHELPEWTSGMCLITLKRCSRYLEYYCCKLLTSFRDFGFEPLLKCLSAHITCEKIRWCCWNHVRTDAVNNSHISIYKIKGQHIYRNWLNICH